MEEKFIYNDEKLTFEKHNSKINLKIFICFSLFFLGLVTGMMINENKKNNDTKEKNYLKKLPIGSEIDKWKDSVFNDYESRAKIYLSRKKFENSPIKAEMLKLAAHNSYELTGVLLPVELALAQAQFESNMGTAKGRSPVNNPFNIGEYDNGTVLWFNDTFSGIQAYYSFMTKNYLKCKSLDTLFKNFANCNGKRYASDSLYEEKIKNQYKAIKKYIDNEKEKIKK